jgi:branched-chain amino acid aminotransferase
MGDWRDTKWAFMDGKIIPIEDAQLNVRCTLLHYGAGIFEGIRAYWNEQRKRLAIFRGPEHYGRMIRNARIIAMDIPYTVGELMDKTMELLKRENFREDTYIRPLAYYKSQNMLEKLKSDQYGLCIFTLPMACISDIEKGQNVCVSSWTRVQDNTISPRGKIVGSYVNISLVLYDAKLSGYDDAIMLNSNGYVSEGAGQNIVMIRNNRFVSPTVADDILEGITLDSVEEIVQNELSLNFDRRSIARTELYHAEELFFCGTGCQVTPIVSVDHRKVGNGKPGPLTKKLQNLFFDIVRGKIDRYSEWLREVT